jgi:hypothetical protein
LQAVECFLQAGADNSHFILQLFRSRVVALGFESQKIVVQITHPLLEFFQVQSESLVCPLGKCTSVHEVIELDGHALTVSVVEPEAEAAEH